MSPTTFEMANGRKIECADSEEGEEGASRIQLEEPKRIKEALLNFTQCHESSVPPEEGNPCHSPGFAGLEPGGEELITDDLQWEAGRRHQRHAGLRLRQGHVLADGRTLPRTVPHDQAAQGRRLPTGTAVHGDLPGSARHFRNRRRQEGGSRRHLADLTRRSMVAKGEAFTQTFAQSAGIQDPAKPTKAVKKRSAPNSRTSGNRSG